MTSKPTRKPNASVSRRSLPTYERKAEAGTDMDIAIRRQRDRLSKLEERIEKRRRELRRKAQVISLAPEVENVCLTLPI